MNTIKEYREQIRNLARESFSEHQFKEEHFGENLKMFYCAKPGTGAYSFRVIFAPGSVIVFGDIGDGIFNISDRDSLRWVRKINTQSGIYLDYVSNKLTHRERKFFPEEAKLCLDEYCKEDPEFVSVAEKIREDWDVTCYYSFNDPETFTRAWYDATGECEYPWVFDWKPETYWLCHALIKFVELYDDRENQNIPSPRNLKVG